VAFLAFAAHANNIFDEWSTPRGAAASPYSSLLGEDDAILNVLTGALPPQGAEDALAEAPEPTPEPTPRRRSASADFLAKLGALHQSREHSKMKLNISIGTGDGAHPLSNLVHNDVVVIGRTKKGGVQPDTMQDTSHHVYIAASVGSGKAVMKKCDKGLRLLSGGCHSEKGLTTLKPTNTAVMCRGGGSKKIYAICSDPEDEVIDRKIELVTEMAEQGSSKKVITCPVGSVVSGGGCDLGGNSQRRIRNSGPVAKNKWSCETDGPVESSWSVHAICMETSRQVNVTFNSGYGETYAECPKGMKILGGGCHHTSKGAATVYLGESAPLLTQGWKCKSKDSDAALGNSKAKLAAVAVCGVFGDPKTEKNKEWSNRKNDPQALIAPAYFSQMNLFVSHINNLGERSTNLMKPIITYPGDDASIATATVSWSDDETPPDAPSAVVPYARTTRNSDLFDDDEEVLADLDDALGISIDFKCHRVGIAPMVMIFAFSSRNQDKRGYERITVGLHKNCSHESIVKIDNMRGFEDIMGIAGDDSETRAAKKRSADIFGGNPDINKISIGSKRGEKDVLSMGVYGEQWNVGSKTPFVAGPKVTAKNFYITLDTSGKIKTVKLEMPTAMVDNSTVVNPKISRVMSKGGYQELGEYPAVVTVELVCKSPGKASIGIVIPTGVGVIDYQFSKVCEEEVSSTVSGEPKKVAEKKKQGHPVLGFMVGTTSGGDEVVSNGYVQPSFELPEVGEDFHDMKVPKRKRNPIISDSVSEKTFHITLKHDFFKIKYSKPTVVADSDKNIAIAYPVLKGNYMRNNMLSRGVDLDLIVKFNCYREGIADIIVTLPLGSWGSIRFAFRKKCLKPSDSEMVFTKKVTRVPGLNIGVFDFDDVVKDGKPRDGYSWDPNSRYVDLIEIGPEFPVSRLVVSHDFIQTSHDAVVFDEPTITAHRVGICDPELGRGTPAPFTLNAEQAAAKVRIMYHCLARGTTIVTIAFPWKARLSGIDSEGVIHIHVIKVCNNPHHEVTRDEGGVDIPGFNIGYKPHHSNVVRDGFPTRHYFGQRNKVNPDWKAIMVDERTMVTKFYLTYSKIMSGDYWGSVDDGAMDAVEFDAPMIHSHDAIARPQLLGQAAKPTRLYAGASASLMIRWNCQFNGTAVASVRIPVLPSGFITFTVPKNCASDKTLEAALRRQADLAAGMFVSTYYDETKVAPGMEIQPDVVDDGITLPEFSTYRSGKRSGRFAVDQFEHSTLFFVWHDKESAPGRPVSDGVAVLEPMIFAHRPICNPSLQHNFEAVEPNNRWGGESLGMTAQSTGFLLLVNEMVHAMNISYNCVWEGETAITVVIPLSNGGKVSYTWTKICTEAEYDQFIPHCLQYKTPEQSESVLGSMWEYVTSFTVAPEQETVHMECEVCEEGYIAISADDLPSVDAEGNEIDNPTYKRDECVRNSTHFGFEDESFDNLDTHHFNEELHGNSPITGEVDANEGWHEHDEVNWKAHPVAAVAAAAKHQSDVSGGVVHIGTYKGAKDVVESNTATRKYSLQGGDPLMIQSSTSETKFYISVPAGEVQKTGYAEVKTRLLEGTQACTATVEGAGARGAVIMPGENVELIVKYQCDKPGATAVLVIVPLEPSSSVSFRIVKLCKGYQTRADRAWMAHKSVLATAFVVLLLMFCFCGETCHGGKKRSSGPGGITLVALDSGEAKMD